VALAQAQRHYLKGYADGREAHSGIAAWFAFCNTGRPHQALGQRTPMAVWHQAGTGGSANMVLDLTLRLNDARASPTCPQPQQQQQLRACLTC
jgi:putative transposase